MPDEYTSIRVPKDAADRARAAKRDDETWADFLDRAADNPPVGEITEDEIRDIATDAVRDEARQIAREVVRDELSTMH